MGNHDQNNSQVLEDRVDGNAQVLLPDRLAYLDIINLVEGHSQYF